jgi:lipopolysaccharide export system permease protein
MTWTLSGYIARRFLGSLVWAFGAVALIVLIGNLIEMLRRNASGRADFGQVLEIALFQTPGVALIALPFVVLLATLACFARLARSSELVVARAAGVSAWAIIAPATLCAVVIGFLSFTALNPLAAATSQRVETLESRYLDGGGGRFAVSGSGVWLRQGDGEGRGQTVIHARGVDGRADRLRDVSLFVFDADGVLLERVDAASARLTDGAWLLREALRRDLSGAEGDAAPRADRPPVAELTVPTDLTTEQIMDSFEAPEAISFWRLPGFIAALEQAGFSAVRHRLHWHSQLAAPLLFAGMAMVGAAFSMRHVRLGGLGLMALGAVLTGFMLFFVLDLAKAFGSSGAVPVALAAWAPPTAAVLLAAGLLLHLEDG